MLAAAIYYLLVFALSDFGSSLQPVNIVNVHPQSIVATYLIAVGIRDFLVRVGR